MTRVRAMLIFCFVVLVAAAAVALVPPGGPRSLRSFDPDRVADLETDMWQAYYRKQNVRLFRGLVTLLHDQYQYPWGRAAMTGFYLARAARSFGDATSNYERSLPDLERAYARINDWTSGGFDPAQVARAELAWWVARRDPETRDPQNVGRLIADENALIFSIPAARVSAPSQLRALAGRLRDEGGADADWPTVSEMLHRSWRGLHTAVN